MVATSNRIARIGRSIRDLSAQIGAFEIVPGVVDCPPQFSPPWSEQDVLEVENLLGFSLPEAYCEFVTQFGSLDAINVASGVNMILPHHFRGLPSTGVLSGIVATIAENLSGVAFPFAADGGGCFFALAASGDDVWRISAINAVGPGPIRLASSFEGFLELMLLDWQSHLDRDGVERLQRRT